MMGDYCSRSGAVTRDGQKDRQFEFGLTWIWLRAAGLRRAAAGRAVFLTLLKTQEKVEKALR
jgi:hypothetical protein